MKSTKILSLIAGIAVLSISSAAQARTVFETRGPNGAAVIAMAPQTVTKASTLSPFNLVSLAYQGYFEDQGITGAAIFLQDARTGDVTAQDLVKAAVSTNRLSAEYLSDTGYVADVDGQLTAIAQDT